MHIPTENQFATCTCDFEIFWIFRVSVIIFLCLIGVSLTHINNILRSHAVPYGQPTSPSLAFLRYYLLLYHFKTPCLFKKNTFIQSTKLTYTILLLHQWKFYLDMFYDNWKYSYLKPSKFTLGRVYYLQQFKRLTI